MDSLVLSDVHLKQLDELRSRIETETGKMLQLTVAQYNTPGDVKIGDFQKRQGHIHVTIFPTYENPYEFGDVDSVYNTLAGVYPSMDDVRQKIEQFRKDNPFKKCVELSKNNSDVYMYVPGSMSICYTIGKWSYVTE